MVEPSPALEMTPELKISPVRPGKALFTHVPMPPIKPPELLEAAADGDEQPDQPPESVAPRLSLFPVPPPTVRTFDQPLPNPPLPTAPPVPVAQPLNIAALSAPGTGNAAPALVNPALTTAPIENIPLPPSMKEGKPPDPESDGEEESSLPGGFEKQVDSVELACIKPELMNIVKRAGQFFRSVPIITSGFRARGRRGSLHRRCMAVDFVVPGVSTQTLASYLKTQPDAGGVGTYCNTRSVHVDIGERRNWGYCGFHRTYFSLR